MNLLRPCLRALSFVALLTCLAPSSLAAAKVTVTGLSPEVQSKAGAIIHRLAAAELAGNYSVRLVSDASGLTATYRVDLQRRPDPDLGLGAPRTPLSDGRRLILGAGVGQVAAHLNALLNTLINEGAPGVSAAARRHLTYQLALDQGAEHLVFQLCLDRQKCYFEPFAPVTYIGPSAPEGVVVGQNYQDGFHSTLSAPTGSWNPAALKAAYTLFGLQGNF